MGDRAVPGALLTGASVRDWRALERDVVSCEACPRLVAHRREVARVKRRAYRDETYWGRPVPGFGDRVASILLVGLAPAAHGANRTGRMFTGDRSGDWLYAALHRAGLADRPESVSARDGLTLAGAFVSAACRCAPPGNRPTPVELDRCSGFLDREFDLLDRLRVVLALGKIAWDACLRRSRRIALEQMPRPLPRFGHGSSARLQLRPGDDRLHLLGSYHPSRQNTQTGRLSRRMFDSVIQRAVRLAHA